MSDRSIYERLEAILRCPVSRQPVRLSTGKELAEINKRISNKELAHLDGTPVLESFEAGYTSQDGRYFHPIIDGIIVLMAHLAIPLKKSGLDPLPLRAEKKILQDFYDQLGWLKGDQDTARYVDAIKWEDLRPVVSDYAHRCHLRVNRYIPNTGVYLLDAGSGPVQYEDYLTYSNGYQYRLCVDISLLALKEARKKLGERGIYILGDITNIPLQDGSVDGAISLHTVYHVPADEQLNAFRELYRTIKPGTSAAVVYSWRNSPLMNFFMFPRKIQKQLRRLVAWAKSLIKKIIRWKGKPLAVSQSNPPANPYHHAYDYRFIVENLADLNVRVFPWRSVGVPFMKTYVHPHLLGRQIMDAVYNFEERSPDLAARIGQYPIVVLYKK